MRESIQQIEYSIDMKNGSGKLGCSNEVKNDFCVSIRMDLSKFLNSTKIETCRQSLNNIERTNFSFILYQADELDNFVTVTVIKDCQTGKIDPAATAIISSNQFENFPMASEVVQCSGLIPNRRQ